MKRVLILFIFLFSTSLFAQNIESIVHLKTKSGTLEGTLLFPKEKKNTVLAIIIPGSGPTNRDGNSPSMRNNSLKMLSEALSKNGIASLRYDKRGVEKSKKAATREINLRFEHYVLDVLAWIDFLKKDNRFSQIIIIGHSEGSLIGMMASQKSDVSKFVSIAGVSRKAHEIIMEQLKEQSQSLYEVSSPILEKLATGERVINVDRSLYSLFRPSVQPYMISWFKYDPKKEISKLDIPVLILQGTTDIQVKQKDANILHSASKTSRKVIIKGMNHILKEVEIDRFKNLQTYNNPNLPIKEELIKEIVEFIKE